DAKGLLAAAIRSPDPVVLMEPKVLYRSPREDVPEGEHVVPLGKARLPREVSRRAPREGTHRQRGRRRDVHRLRRDGGRRGAGGGGARGERRSRRRPLPQAPRLGDAARVGGEEGARRDRPGGTARRRFRRRDRGAPRREGDPRPARSRDPRDRLRRSLPLLVTRGRAHPFAGAGGRGRRAGSLFLMAYEFKLPDLGEGVREGEVARWLVEVGQDVAEDDPLVEIQTDKTTVEIPSPAAGKVAQILVAEGELVPVGTPLVLIGSDGEAPARAPEKVQATPLVRRIAEELGVDLASVRGTGSGGRITEEDVRGRAAPVEGERREPLRGVRRQIAEHLTRAHREVPAVTVVEECDFTALSQARGERSYLP